MPADRRQPERRLRRVVDRFNFLVQWQPAAAAIDHIQEAIVTGLEPKAAGDLTAKVRGEEETLERRPAVRVTVRADGAAHRERQQQQSEGPDGLRTWPGAGRVGAAPLFAHEGLRTPEESRARACSVFS